MASNSARGPPAYNGDTVSVTSVLDRLCICAICQEELKQPKFLPCLHSFCTQCLRDKTAQNQAGDRFLCLEKDCKADAFIPPGGVAEFPDNIFLANIIGSRQQNNQLDYLCDFCKQQQREEPAEARCLQCREFLCADCANVHNQTSLTVNHEVRPLGNLSSATLQENIHRHGNGTAVNRGDYCMDHPDQVVQFYCHQCKKAICEYCTQDEHRGHKKIKLQTLVQQYRGQTLVIVGKLKNKMADLQQLSMTYNPGITLKNKEQVKAQIQKTKQNMIKALEEEEQRLLAEVDRAFKINERQGKGTSFQKAVQGHEYDLSSSVEITETLFNHGIDTELVHMHPAVKARLEGLDKASLPIPPEQLSYQFKPGTRPILGTVHVDISRPKPAGNTQKQNEVVAKKMIPGSKVRRGRDWRYGNEDGSGLGTVVEQVFGSDGQSSAVTYIKVKWDKTVEPFFSFSSSLGKILATRSLWNCSNRCMEAMLSDKSNASIFTWGSWERSFNLESI